MTPTETLETIARLRAVLARGAGLPAARELAFAMIAILERRLER